MIFSCWKQRKSITKIVTGLQDHLFMTFTIHNLKWVHLGEWGSHSIKTFIVELSIAFCCNFLCWYLIFVGMTVRNDDVCCITKQPPLFSQWNHNVSHCLSTWLVWMKKQTWTKYYLRPHHSYEEFLDRYTGFDGQIGMGGVYQGLGGLSPPMKPRTFRHSSMEGIAIITCSMVDEHLTIKVICCWLC